MDEPPWASGGAARPRRGEPATVQSAPPEIQVLHADFCAGVDPEAAVARLYRSGDDALGLVVTLRVAVAARLPFEGGLLLHAAGLVTKGRALVFPGESGAGKTTLAEAAPWPLLSDELVALVPGKEGFLAAPTPFRSPLPRRTAEPAPLHALIGLAKEPGFRLSPLDRRTALRRLVACAAVPQAPQPWTRALEVVAALSRCVPAYVMGWSPGEPPWDRLSGALALGPGGSGPSRLAG